MAKSFPDDNLLPLLVGSTSTTCYNAAEVAQWATTSCSQPQAATNNGVRDDRSN